MLKNVFLILSNAILFSVNFTETEHGGGKRGGNATLQLIFCSILRVVIMLCISFQIANAHFSKHMLHLTKTIILCSIVCFLFEILLLRYTFLKILSFFSALLPVASLALTKRVGREREGQRGTDVHERLYNDGALSRR